MAKSKSVTAVELLARILTSATEHMGAAEVQAAIEAAGIGAEAKSGKSGKADKKSEKAGKADKKAKGKKLTAEAILNALEEGNEVDLESAEESVLREVVISLKLATKAKSKGLDKDDLIELLAEFIEESSDDEDEDDADDEDEDDADDEDEDDADDEDEDDADDEDEDDADDEDEDGVDLDDLDEDELRALVIEHELATKAKAKKMDEDELRELLEEHFSGEEDEDDEDEDDSYDEDDEDEEDDE